MIQLYTDEGLIIGLTKMNIDRLKDKKPISIDIRMNIKKLTIIYGDTKPDMIADIEKAGLELPEVVKQSLLESPD